MERNVHLSLLTFTANKFMKQFLLLLFCIPQLLLAQSNWCGTPDRALGNTPSVQEQNLMHLIRNNMQHKSGDSLLIIPTVVHIIHTNGIGDISNLQVEDGIRVVNEDFRRMNTDTVNGNPIFYPFAADCKIEFRLAKLDPNGDSPSAEAAWGVQDASVVVSPLLPSTATAIKSIFINVFSAS